MSATAKYREATQTVEVVKTKNYISAGDKITAADVEMTEVQEETGKNFIKDKEKVVGKIPSTPLLEGQFILSDNLQGKAKKDGFVEIYIPVELSSSAMAVSGEKVDIHLVNKQDRGAEKANMIYEGARVLHSFNQEGKNIKPGDPGVASKVKMEDQIPAAVGVEVPADMSEKIVQHAQNDAVYLVVSDEKD